MKTISLKCVNVLKMAQWELLNLQHFNSNADWAKMWEMPPQKNIKCVVQKEQKILQFM